MTPLWRRHIKRFLNTDILTKTDEGRRLLASRCFDFTAVEPVLSKTAATMASAMTRETDVRLTRDGAAFRVDVGERVILPAANTWLEWQRSNGSRWAIWLEGVQLNSSGQSCGIAVAMENDRINLIGGLSIANGVASVVRGYAGKIIFPTSLTDDLGHELGETLALTGLAALSFLASQAAEHAEIEAHRGLARRLYAITPEARQITHTSVSLGREFNHSGASRQRTLPVALHFCRAHARRKLGKIEHVRAHWRGDPAFGVRLPTYAVTNKEGASAQQP